jgi:hypothetical protein
MKTRNFYMLTSLYMYQNNSVPVSSPFISLFEILSVLNVNSLKFCKM